MAHLKTNVIVLLGHTGCGAIKAAMDHKACECEGCLDTSDEDRYIRYIIEDITCAIKDEKDDHKASVLNVRHGVEIIRQAFADHKEIDSDRLDVLGAVYNIETGMVEWI